MEKNKLAEIRDKLIREIKAEKDEVYKIGFIDGVLDMYNEVKDEYLHTQVQERV